MITSAAAREFQQFLRLIHKAGRLYRGLGICADAAILAYEAESSCDPYEMIPALIYSFFGKHREYLGPPGVLTPDRIKFLEYYGWCDPSEIIRICED